MSMMNSEGMMPPPQSGLVTTRAPSKSFSMGVKVRSRGLMTFGRSIKSGVTRAVFPEDLKVSEKMIFDPQDKSLLLWNRFFVISCIMGVSIDPLFLYLPEFNQLSMCLGFNDNLAYTTMAIRTAVDAFYILRIAFQFRTAFIAPSSRVFGRGELVIDPGQIAKRYFCRYFFVDMLSVLPMPQMVVHSYLTRAKGATILWTKTSLLWIIFIQYIPRFVRFLPLTSELKKSAGVFAESALAGAAYYLLWYLLASHIAGALWYLLAVERYDACWQQACAANGKCNKRFLYCGQSRHLPGHNAWKEIRADYLQAKCSAHDETSPFDYGIYQQAIKAQIIVKKDKTRNKRESEILFLQKLCYCLWWGLQNLSTLGQGLQTSTYHGEVLFSIALAIFGLILFALLIGNMQTYLQSLTIRLEEMRIKRRDSEQWMHHRLLPPELRDRVRRYDQYKWLETRGVDEETLVMNLPKDLRRDIKRHLCLSLVRRVPLFDNLDERLLDAICERLKPCLYTESTYIVREGDPVDEMLFIIRGRLESVTTDGGRTGFFNRSFLKEGDFCGEELLTWALDPKAAVNLPLSTRTVKALSEVEAFALQAEELKFVATQFRRLHSRQVQHTFRFYSQQWRTWAACFIQSAWRRYTRRKVLEQRRRDEEEEDRFFDEDEYESEYESESDDGGGGDDDDDKKALISSGSSSSLGATLLASKFAANALRGIRGRSLKKLQKPAEPDFSALDEE